MGGEINKQLLSWEWYQDSYMLHLFVHFLLKSDHDPVKWKGIIIEKGQLVTCLKELKEETGISVQRIRTCLKRMKKSKILTHETTNKFSLITILDRTPYKDQVIKANKQNNKLKTRKETTKKDEFIPPTLEEWKEYCRKEGYLSIAEKSYKYYKNLEWCDSQGKKIKSWKSKLIAIWFKKENKDISIIECIKCKDIGAYTTARGYDKFCDCKSGIERRKQKDKPFSRF